jgi:uncharacterized membrane protein
MNEHYLKRLPQMTPDELVKALKKHFDSVGGLATTTEVEIARELVRRARELERTRRGA